MNRVFAIAAALFLLTGCENDKGKIKVTEAFFSVKLLDSRPESWEPNVVGMATGGCIGLNQIEILKEYYPECLTHEIRHVFECDWHEERAVTCR